MLTPWLGRAAAHALVPAALLATPALIGMASSAAAAPTRQITSTVATTSLQPVALTTNVVLSGSAALTPAQSYAVRHAAWLRRVAAHNRAVLVKDRAVVRWALAHVGYRYSAGSSGPRAFDCSGLTLAAWRTQGVSLPHYSAAQWSRVRHVSLRQIRPGDLVFYLRGGAHHVAIYVGRGLMVSADRAGRGVRLEPFLFSWFGSHFTGVGRVIS